MTDAQPARRHPSFFYPGEPIAADEMRITALGTGMPFVRRQQASAGWLVELGNGDVFIFDLGTASTTNLNALGVPHAKLDKVFLTHLHVDHWGDLTSLYAVDMVRDRFTRLHVWGPSGPEPHLLPAVLRGTAIGSLLGSLPGGGPVLSSFASYTVEKKLADDPSRFGRGAIEGVAGPEAANNAAAQTSFIPLLTLGIPANPVMALMIGAMMIHGITPGPRVMTAQPGLFWGIIASMWIGNAMLLVLNLPLIGLWVRLLATPYRLLFPMIVLFCSLGAYALNNSAFEVLVMAAAGVAGYGFRKLGCDTAPLLMAMVLGPMMEENFRRAMLLSQGRLAVFVERPISLGLLTIGATLLLFVLIPTVRRSRETAFRE